MEDAQRLLTTRSNAGMKVMSLSTKETNLPFSIMARSPSTVCYCRDRYPVSTGVSRVTSLPKLKQSLKCEEAMWHDSSSSVSSWPELLLSRKRVLLGVAAVTFALKPIGAYQV